MFDPRIPIGQNEFRLMVEAAPSGMIMIDTTGSIIVANAQVEKLFGYTKDELLGQSVEILVPMSLRHDHVKFREQYYSSPETRAMGHGRDLFGRRKDGTQVPVEIGLNPIKTESGFFVVASIIDITERRNAEQLLLQAKLDLEQRVQERTSELSEVNAQLKVANEEAMTASKLKSEFLANMSHEIRTPMNAIIGMCNVLLRSGLESRQQEYASNIKDGASALLTVINDILDFSKIEAGKIDLEVIEFDIVTLVEGACQLLATSARFKQLSLMTFIAPDVPRNLYGDPERIRQILINLISNAIKFSDRGEIVVRASLDSRENGSARIKFTVTDQGMGMTSSESAKLFQPFVQADGTISRRFGGTGLGLSISRRLVELMNGEMGVQSTRGEGSSFWFTVPFRVGSHFNPLSLAEDLKDTRVLIVDDEPQAREILCDYLSAWGVRCSKAANVKDALRALRQAYVDAEPYHLCITDFVMPDANGFDMAKSVLADLAISSTKMILLTAFDSPGLGTQSLELGFKAYLTKPVRQSQLYECIITVLRGEERIARSAIDSRASFSSAPERRSEVILVAEDYPINQQVAQLYLDEFGFTAHIVSNGLEAVNAVKTNEYGLVLMDCQMPDMDGFSATQAIREFEKESGRHIPIIAMTAHAMGGDRERCLQAGMDDYIAKPVEPQALRAVIELWLRKNGETNEPVRTDVGRKKFGRRATDLYEMFVSSAPQTAENIETAVSARDYGRVIELAHGFRGVCATIYAHRLCDVLRQLETSANEKDDRALDEFAVQLEYELRLAIHQLRVETSELP